MGHHLAPDLVVRGNNRGALGGAGNSEGQRARPDLGTTLRGEGSSWYSAALGRVETHERFPPARMSEDVQRQVSGQELVVTEKPRHTQATLPQGRPNPA